MATSEILRDVTTKLFDPQIDVSADAKYIVRHLVIWFLVFPPALGLIVWVAYNLIHAVTNSVH